jgi:hypothetical protein
MVKKMRSCPGCARSIDEQQFPFGLAFCPYCGDTLPPPEQGEVLRYCPYCGLEQSCPADFCPHCGKKILVSQAIPRQGYKPEPAPTSRFQAVIPPVEEPPACQAEAAEDMDFSGYGTGYAANYRSKPGILLALRSGAGLIWGKFSGFIGEYVSGRYRVKQLYRTWTRHSALPEEEVPSGEALAQITRECGAETYRPLRMSLVILAFVGLVLFFVGVGFVIRSC